MPTIGSIVDFNFITTSAHFDGCVEDSCDCIARRFKVREGQVLAVHEDGSLDIDVQMEQEDIDELGMSIEVVTKVKIDNGDGSFREETNRELISMDLDRARKLGIPIHRNVPKCGSKVPLVLTDSGTWSEK